MAGLTARLTPIGRAEVIVPDDQTPILDIVEGHRTVLILTPRRLDEVSPDELEAAKSLLAALTVFVEHCQRWATPATDRAMTPSARVAGGAA